MNRGKIEPAEVQVLSIRGMREILWAGYGLHIIHKTGSDNQEIIQPARQVTEKIYQQDRSNLPVELF
jgi:hypothetical protein